MHTRNTRKTVLHVVKAVFRVFCVWGFRYFWARVFHLTAGHTPPVTLPVCMVTQFILRNDKKDKAGKCPVYLLVYFDGARLKCAAGEKCKPTDWKADRQCFRASYPLAEEANDLLKLLAGNVLAWWHTLRAAGEAPTLDGLRAVLRAAPAPAVAVLQRTSVSVWYDAYRRSMKTRGYAFETLRHHLVTRNWMVGFEQCESSGPRGRPAPGPPCRGRMAPCSTRPVGRGVADLAAKGISAHRGADGRSPGHRLAREAPTHSDNGSALQRVLPATGG